jgi:stress response protein YsnF
MRTRGEPHEVDHRVIDNRWVDHAGTISRQGSGWRVIVPLRQEHVSVRRRVVAVKEVRVSTRLTEERAHFE